MDLRDSPDETAFREQVRGWLAENLPAETGREWSRKMFDAGYAGLTWPEEYGGSGAPYSHQAIALEEFARAEAPNHMNVIALGMAGPTIMAHGTEEHKQRYLSKMLSAEEIWCQGFSEPGAGSDLAAVRTRIEPADRHFLVNGQKVWSSLAHEADFCILVGRGDPESHGHAGLTYVIVDMHAPGVEVRPLRQITGEAEFNEIFIEGAEVPDENLIGGEGNGWNVAITTLMHERAGLGAASAISLRRDLDELIELLNQRGLGDDPVVRERIAELKIGVEALRLGALRALTQQMKVGIPGPEGSLAKWEWASLNQRLTELAADVLGP
ncbi:MAG: acyl-CoA dehydrogenase family protein, partial [Actinomycetota bacterium]|nr:acyl-CoA dehydrogenase family protein [Actinomycetota bacterium]